MKPGFIGLEVCAYKLVVEEEGYIGHGFQVVEQAFVEAAAVNSKDGLVSEVRGCDLNPKLNSKNG